MAVRPRGPVLPVAPRLLGPSVALVALLIALFAVFVSQYTELLWFREVNFSKVFSTVLETKVLLFVVFAVVMALVIGANLVVAYRVRPSFEPVSLEQQNLERYRVAIEPYLGPVLAVISVLFGIFAGLAGAGRWQTWLLFTHRTHWGQTDPQFHKDLSYFAFVYPFQRFLLGYGLAVVLLSLFVAAVTHYLFGGVRLQTAGEKVSPAARAHLSVLLGLVVLLKAVAYWLDRYGLAFSTRGVVEGASYTDVHAVLPAKGILTAIAVICALLFFANIVVRNILLPAGALALLVVSAIAIGGIYPAIVQQFGVKPNEVAKEKAYIGRNIQATRAAYGINGSIVTTYSGTSTASATAVQKDQGTIPNARLLDPNILGETFSNLQSLKPYFSFGESLDIDRYAISGKEQDYVVAVRELNQAGLNGDQRNWINLHLAYTHGNGFVSAQANTPVPPPDGTPKFASKDLPANGASTTAGFALDQTRVYYGEDSPDYSIVDTKQAEIDGPGDDTGVQSSAPYDGGGGVQLNSGARKLLYALKFGEKNVLLSGSLTSDSRIMYHRTPQERVKKVAPYLTLDGDPYPAVVDGRILWIVDGYTTSDGFPYAQSQSFGDVTTDSSQRSRTGSDVNYIRNSVKATVDAYSGKVTLYQWDDTDPVLKTWMKVFPGTVKPKSDLMGDADLLAHIRYPEDLFKVQRSLLAKYHVTEPTAFYGKEDFWEVPADPTQTAATALNNTSGATPAAGAATTSTGGPAQPPYYALLQFPGLVGSRFSLTSTFVQRGRNNLSAFAAVSSDTGETGDYGQIRVLELPQNSNVAGPGQVANNFETDQNVSNRLLSLRQSGSNVVLGNLLTLPVQGGLLYVEPVYAQAKQGTAYPIFNSVIVSFNGQVNIGTTLQGALSALFTGASTTPTTTPTTTPSTGPSATPSPGSSTPPVVTATAAQLAVQLQAALTAANDALARQDFAEYGVQQRKAAALSSQLVTALGGSGSATPAPSPTR